MTNRVWLLGAIVLGLSLSGCGSDPPPEETTENKSPVFVPFELTASIDISLADLLNKSRKELASLGEEWGKKVDFQEQAYRKGEARFDFLPAIRLPLAIPVWRQARYSGALDLSVPPYYSGGKDADLALHLARHGDVDGALKLIEPGDTRTRGQVEALRLDRNYPVEWTRLVALMLHEGEFRLATNDQHGARQFVMLHQQLLGLLAGKARASALGTALLPRGRGFLIEAEAEWRKTKEVAVADQAKVVLAAWGEGSWSAPALRPGISREQTERILQSQARGQVLVAPSTLRALDLLALPLPEQALDGVACCFDPDGKLREVLLTYQSRLPERIPYPAQLAALLEENDAFSATSLPETGQVRRRLYRHGNFQVHVETVPENPVVGALVRIPLTEPPADRVTLPRSFGEVNLDRSFEQNRARVALKQRKNTLEVTQQQLLQRVEQPLKQPELRLDQAGLEKAPNRDLLQRLTLTYAYPKTALPLHQFAEPLWALAGSADIQDVRDGAGGHLALTWGDAQTSYVLRLPHRRERAPHLEVNDLTAPNALEKRSEKVREADLAERRERFKQKNAFVRLPRELEKVRLGMTENAFLKALPKEKDALRRKIDGGWAVSYLKLSKKSPFVARELAARFDSAGRVAEVRVFYSNAPGTPGADALLAEWKKEGGAPEVVKTGPAAAAWSDLPDASTAPLYRWRDDVTVANFQVESVGAVATLRDCPVEDPEGLPLPALATLPRGTGGIELGMTREEVTKKWGGKDLKEADGFLVLPSRDRGEFDVILVKFDGDRAERILARHTLGKKTRPEQMGELLKKTWASSFRNLGWQMREFASPELNLPGWATRDERTRCRIFWEQDAGDNLRLLTEWKALR